MNFKIYLYVISVMLGAYILSGINFDKIMKKNKVIEARLLVIVLSFIIGYFITNFIVDFTSSFNLI